MSSIIIRNIGPLKSVELALNKINVLMGPQSSGKSTIAKIVSFCQWAEKRYILDGGKFDYDFREMFMDFHKVSETYFSKESFFEYDSEYVKISCTGTKYQLKFLSKKKNAEFKKSKNIFIPAERNFVSAIPNLGKYNETNDNIMSFLYDWFDAKKNYSDTNPLSILDLGIEYSFEKDIDQLTLLNVKKKLRLNDASSGLQSITPLVMLIDYLTEGFYTESKTNSVYEREELVKTVLDNINSVIDRPLKLRKEGVDIVEKMELELNTAQKNTLVKLLLNRGRYFYTNFVIEEPEQNLFPTTQRDLIYYLFDKLINTDRTHSLLITTHSPFILYAINNCILGRRINEDMPEDEKQQLKSHKSWVNPANISIWQTNNGSVQSVLDERTGTVTKHYFNEVMNELLEEYYDMLNYFKDDRPT